MGEEVGTLLRQGGAGGCEKKWGLGVSPIPQSGKTFCFFSKEESYRPSVKASGDYRKNPLVRAIID
jgi:hypothetical protein